MPTSTAQPGDAKLADEQLVALVARETGAAVDEVQAMLDGVRRGEDAVEFFGLTPQLQASLENCGVAYYRGRRTAEARQVFEALIYLTDGRRASAWRGVAACHQSEHDYTAAVEAYAHALVLDHTDTLSAASCGECLCLLGRREEGLQMLNALLAEAPETEAKAPHVLRAAALVAAGGGPGTPSPLARSGAARDAVADERGAAAEDDTAGAADENDADADDEELLMNAGLEALEGLESNLARRRKLQPADPALRAQLEDPQTRERLEAIAKAVHKKTLTIRTLADFSEEQMDAGYAVACTYLERGELLQAMHTCTMMLYIDSRDSRFYQLAGLTAHHMKLWCLADYFYALHGIWSPTGPDAATLIYQGEAKMLTAEPEAGLALVREGIARGRTDPEMAELVRRGEALLKQGSNLEAKFAEFTLGGIT